MKFQVLITGIKWNSDDVERKHKAQHSHELDLPNQFTLDLPENILNRANNKQNDFNDVVEEFCYNFLTRKFGIEVSKCQIWLPLED